LLKLVIKTDLFCNQLTNVNFILISLVQFNFFNKRPYISK